MGRAIRADVYDVISDSGIPWQEFKGCTVLITGATGLIGSFIARALAAANIKHGLGMRLIGHGRDKSKGACMAQELDMEFASSDIRRPSPIADITDTIGYVFHCASITKSADMITRPADVKSVATDGTKNTLDLALQKGCRSFVYVSSMEVYGQTALSEVKEGDLGHIDPSDPRSSYPESKRICETLCAEYAARYGLPVKIARLAQTFGAGTPKDDTRVFAQFARSAAGSRDIELHTEGRSRGNYCCTSDAVRGMLTVLFRGENGAAYNIANTAASVTIREHAELVAGKVCSGRINVIVKVPEDIKTRGYAPDAGYTLNTDKLKTLGWAPKYGLEEMYGRLLADWREREEES